MLCKLLNYTDFNDRGQVNGEVNDKLMENEAHLQLLEGCDMETLAPSIDASSDTLKMNDTKLVSNWYLHKCAYDSCEPRWSAFVGVDEEEANLNQRSAGVPIIHKHKFVDKHWVTKSFTIKNAEMRQILAKVLHEYQDLDLELEDWTFKPPFRPLVHRWDVLKAYQASLSTGPLKDAANTLLAFLIPIVASSVASLAQTKKTGKVSFQDVWQVFQPSSFVTTKFYGADIICRAVKYSYKGGEEPCWLLDVEYVDWNGEDTGYATTTITIREFEGFRKVTKLPVFPISFLSNVEKTKSEAIERGRKFERLRGYNHLLCSGAKVLLETKCPELRPIAGKVCVDAYAYYRSCNLVKAELKPLEDKKAEIVSEVTEDAEDGENSDTPFEAEFSAAPIQPGSTAKGPAERIENRSPLTNEQCLLTTPWMKGFDLKPKDWCELRVDELREMTWNDEAFDKLVLPSGEKDLAWAFVENKALSQAGFDDFIPDKGRGLIILMFGPPGVGKTFTAEAIAERSRVPLYSIGAGELGTRPADVEKALNRALELCRMWNAMLLLDEADIFLGARTNDSLARNELVSIFLTKLEYYQGIIFLTTNRIASIDHAFQSRVDLFLPYHDLTCDARRQVWENFIERAGRDKFDVDEESLNKLSQLNLNGREIKNLIKSAQLLSWKNGGKVPMDRVYMLADRRVQALSLFEDGDN